jgi:hypothetical protein
MKLDKNYKMNKMTKILIAMMPDQTHRSVMKKAFAEAEQHASNSKKKMSVKHVATESDD